MPWWMRMPKVCRLRSTRCRASPRGQAEPREAVAASRRRGVLGFPEAQSSSSVSESRAPRVPRRLLVHPTCPPAPNSCQALSGSPASGSSGRSFPRRRWWLLHPALRFVEGIDVCVDAVDELVVPLPVVMHLAHVAVEAPWFCWFVKSRRRCRCASCDALRVAFISAMWAFPARGARETSIGLYSSRPASHP